MTESEDLAGRACARPHSLPERDAGGRRRARPAGRDAGAGRVSLPPPPLQRRRHARRRQSLCADRDPPASSLLRRTHRCGPARAGIAVAASALCRRDRRRRALWPRRLGHEGRDRRLHRGRARFRAHQGRRPSGIDQPAHHRRRGRPLDQRHPQDPRLDERARRAARPRRRRRADQPVAYRRGHQDRPARQPQWPPHHLAASRGTSPIPISPTIR